MVTMRVNAGARALKRALKEQKESLRGAGRRIGTSGVSVARWISGERVPRISWALKIQRAFGVPALSWGQP